MNAIRLLVPALALVLGVAECGAAPIFEEVAAPKAQPAFLPKAGAQPIRLNPAVLGDLRPGGVSEFTALSGEALQVRWSHSFDHASGNITWVGEAAPYGQLNRVALTFFSGGVTGTLRLGGRQWDVNTYGDQTWLIDYQVAGIKLIGAGDEAVPPAAKTTRRKSDFVATPPTLYPETAPDAGMRAFPRSPLPKADTTVSTVDIMILATTELQNFYGGATQTKAVFDRLIAFNNQAYIDSGVTNLKLNLISSGALTVDASWKIEQILDGYNPSKPDYLKTSRIAEMREETGADLIAILIPQDSTVNGGHCGSANLPMLERDLATQSNEMMSVTASGPALRGQEFKCGEDGVFAHELGHNFGLMHDRATLVKQGAALSTQNKEGGVVGAFAYGFGYGITGKFCDIMCYSQNFGVSAAGNITASGYQTARPVFSNPNLSLPSDQGGDRYGVPETDTLNSAHAALALSNAAAKVAAYRSPPKAKAAASFEVQSGWWWNPNESGRGFFIEVSKSNVLMSGYIYASDGKPTWFIATGPLTNTTFTGSMQTYANGQTLTGNYTTPVSTTSLGTITITFDAPDSATLQWSGGTMAIERVDFADGNDDAVEDKVPFEALGDSGWWWNSAESGRGFSIEIQGDTIVIAGYMYDGSGNPIWYLGSGKLASFKQFKGQWQQYANGQSIGGTYRAPTLVNGSVGEMTITFSSFTAGTMTLPNGKTIPISRFVF